MSSEQEPNRYEPFACGYDCHPDRYTSFTKRTRLGQKRWGVRDNHMQVNLGRLCNGELELYHWLVSLRTMEIRERWSSAREMKDATR
ncbi:hypothetical protein [Streptomyces sp. NPDC093589]|uniref:hypothetical protein n=1 Tax=Streptomyces sp. NPDC093589 TaxID=3366043 RepID=UPI00382E46B7